MTIQLKNARLAGKAQQLSGGTVAPLVSKFRCRCRYCIGIGTKPDSVWFQSKIIEQLFGEMVLKGCQITPTAFPFKVELGISFTDLRWLLLQHPEWDEATKQMFVDWLDNLVKRLKAEVVTKLPIRITFFRITGNRITELDPIQKYKSLTAE